MRACERETTTTAMARRTRSPEVRVVVVIAHQSLMIVRWQMAFACYGNSRLPRGEEVRASAIIDSDSHLRGLGELHRSTCARDGRAELYLLYRTTSFWIIWPDATCLCAFRPYEPDDETLPDSI
jgi:hypothetical protein